MRYLIRGFTLIELITTLAVVAIVLSIAIPSFKSQMLNNRSVALGEDFALAINMARSEAVKRAARVSICASKSGVACDGDSWGNGFVLFTDGATHDSDADPLVEKILKIWPKQDASAVISVKSDNVDVAFVRYTGLGTLARVNDKPIEILISMEKCTDMAARKINIGLSGLVSIERAHCKK